LQALHPGQEVPTTLLASATTSQTGSYTFTAPPAALKAAVVDQGWANLEVETVGGASWDFAYQTDQAKTVTVNLNTTGLPTCPSGTATTSPWYFSKQLNKAWDVIGQGYVLQSSLTVGDFVNFDYERTQTSTLGIGASATAEGSGFHAAGTESESTSSGVGFPHKRDGVWFRTQFRVALYHQFCLGHQGHPQKGCPTRTPDGATDIIKCLFKVRSDGWSGGATILYPRTVPHTPSFDCNHYIKGAHFNTDYGKAVTWSQGFELSAADKIGFNAQTETGYDVHGRTYFHFGHQGYLCGTNANDATAAQLVARGTLP